MNIPDEVMKRARSEFYHQHPLLTDLGLEAAAQYIAEWARKEALREAAAFVKSEIERLELVKGTYAKAQRHSLGMVWGHIRADVLAEGVSDGQQ